MFVSVKVYIDSFVAKKIYMKVKLRQFRDIPFTARKTIIYAAQHPFESES